jgi:hypothetical protein
MKQLVLPSTGWSGWRVCNQGLFWKRVQARWMQPAAPLAR